MESRLQEVLARMRAQDPLRLVESCQVEWTVEPLQERRYSTIYALKACRGAGCVRAAIGSDEIVLKLYHACAPERRQAEFDDLCRVYEALSSRQMTAVSVPRPIAAFADLGAILTVRAPGVCAGGVIRAACRRHGNPQLLAAMAALCTRMGNWLREFQRVGGGRMAGQSPRHLATRDDFVAYVDERLLQLTQLRPGIDRAVRTLAVEHLRRLLATVDAEHFAQVTWSHADFGPHNVLVDGEVLTVLDFELRPEHPYFDVSYFIESLAGLRTPFADPDRLSRLETAFLTSYGTPLHPALLHAFRLRHLVCSYLSHARRRGLARLRAWPDLMSLRARLASSIATMRAGSFGTLGARVSAR